MDKSLDEIIQDRVCCFLDEIRQVKNLGKASISNDIRTNNLLYHSAMIIHAEEVVEGAMTEALDVTGRLTAETRGVHAMEVDAIESQKYAHSHQPSDYTNSSRTLRDHMEILGDPMDDLGLLCLVFAQYCC